MLAGFVRGYPKQCFDGTLGARPTGGGGQVCASHPVLTVYRLCRFQRPSQGPIGSCMDWYRAVVDEVKGDDCVSYS